MNSCVLIAIYDHASTIEGVIESLVPLGLPILVVDDGSDEETQSAIERARSQHSAVWVLRLPHNQGRGAALQFGYREAARRGFSHTLQLDADAQHDVADAPHLLSAAARNPRAVVLGARRFDPDAPRARRWGRWVSIIWVWIETCSFAVHDPLCGYRCMPLDATLAVLDRVVCGKHMEFDPEIVVRLIWAGVAVINVPTHVRYYTDGISHFDMLRDNVRMVRTHARLVLGMLSRLPRLLARRVGSGA